MADCICHASWSADNSSSPLGSTNSDAISNGNCLETQLTKKTNKPRIRQYVRRNRPTAPPKMFKHDIRRQYSTMFTNVMNSADFSMWSSFFDTFFHPDLHYIQRAATNFPIVYANAPKQIEMYSSKHCSQFIFNHMSAIPDMTMRLQDTKITLLTDGSKESTITLSFEVSGTKLYVVPGERQRNTNDDSDEQPFERNNKMRHELKSTSTSCNSSFGLDEEEPNGEDTFLVNYISHAGRACQLVGYSVEKYQELLDRAPMEANPIPIKLTAAITLHLDVNKKIIKFDGSSVWKGAKLQ